MARYLLFLTAAAAVLGEGYLYGRWTGRWHGTRELTEAAARLQSLPLTVGDWKGETLELEPAVVERAGFSGYVLRRYENQRTGAAVSLLVACGRPGPLAAHTPEVCYRGVGFHMLSGEGTRATLEGAPDGNARSSAEVFKAVFAREDSAAPERLRVVWSWCRDGAWTAPDDPRWRFAGTPVLHKVYVTQVFLPRDEGAGEDCLAFLRDLLPELDKVTRADR
jgi:EpsI family protein